MAHAPIDAGITFLRVSDLKHSHRFYFDVMGLEMVVDQGGCRIYRLTDSAFLGICERQEPIGSNVIVTIVGDDVDGWYRRLTEAGVETDGQPRDNEEYRIYQFFAKDPDGHLLEFQRFWDDDWKRR